MDVTVWIKRYLIWFVAPLVVTPLESHQCLWYKKIESLGYFAALFAFGRFDVTTAYDEQTDRQKAIA